VPSSDEGGLLGASLPDVTRTPSTEKILLAERARTAAAKAAAEDAMHGMGGIERVSGSLAGSGGGGGGGGDGGNGGARSPRVVRFVDESSDCEAEAERDAGDTAGSNSDTMSEGEEPNPMTAVKEAFSHLSASTRALLAYG